uniref:Zgc:158689 n=1 Tax=Erpetoichthys calabaricus TaxID=27687 RepID=A0A8C4SYW2_ERPCA
TWGLASEVSRGQRDTLFQMAEVHRQIQVQLEDMLKLFHSELLSQLEHKLDLDIKYLTVSQADPCRLFLSIPGPLKLSDA